MTSTIPYHALQGRPGSIQKRHYTDLAVVLGPNERWTEYDYEDLQRYAPEVLLGYRVLLTTPFTYTRLHGRRIAKLVILDGLQAGDPRTEKAVWEAIYRSDAVETYRVHRGSNPIVQRLA